MNMEATKSICKHKNKRLGQKERRQKRPEKIFAILKQKEKTRVPAQPARPPSAVVALDCEMVGSSNGDLLGLTPQVIFERGITFAAARALVRTIIQDKILVGHAIHNDLQVLSLQHPLHLIRDTSTYKRLRPPNFHGTPSLRHLARHWLGEVIQTGVHDSLEDCRVALRMYFLFNDEWERQFTALRNSGPLLLQNKLQLEEEDTGCPEPLA